MPSRRALRILAAVGVILIVVGIIMALVGTSPALVSGTGEVPPGWEYYTEFNKAVLAGGTIQGTWQSLNGTPVQVLVYNDQDYGAFVNGQNLTGLYNATGLSGTISLNVSGFDTYHVVIQHASGYENTDQNVSVDLTMSGADPTFTLGGVAATVVGALFAVYAVRKSRQAQQSAGTLSGPATMPTSPGQPSGPDSSTLGGGMYRVPPPLPGTPAGRPSPPGRAASGTAASSDGTEGPTGTVLVTIVNRAPADATVDLVVNGAPVTSMTVPAGGSQQISVTARLSSIFGATVTVEAMMAGGRRARQAVFVGAGGTAPVSLQVG